MFELYVEPYLPHGETYLTDDRSGAAVWLPPAAQLLDAEQEQAFAERWRTSPAPPPPAASSWPRSSPSTTPTSRSTTSSSCPRSPPCKVGASGRHSCARCCSVPIEENMPAYHEATTLRNRALYERHGYVNQGDFTLPDGGPTLWRMWREPR